MTFAVLAATTVVLAGSAPWRIVAPRCPDGGGRPSWTRPVVDVFVHRWIERTDLDLDPPAVRRIWLVSVVVGAGLVALITGFSSSTAVGIGALAGAITPVGIAIARRDRAEARLIASLPEMLELLARSLRGGADIHTALRDVAGGSNEIGRTLDQMLRRIDAGERLGEAMDRWVVELGHEDASVVRAVIRLGDSTGGSMANALDAAAATLRERSALRAEIRALTSQSRASAMVVALSPLAFLIVVAGTDQRSSHVLFSTATGRLCLIGGLFLDGLGVMWMHRLTLAATG